MFLTSVCGILDFTTLAGISAVTGVFGALMFLIGSVVFLPSSNRMLGGHMPAVGVPVPATLHSRMHSPGLPPQTQQPAAEYAAPAGGWRAPYTGDLVGPGSVVEGTTKLLQRDE